MPDDTRFEDSRFHEFVENERVRVSRFAARLEDAGHRQRAAVMREIAERIANAGRVEVG